MPARARSGLSRSAPRAGKMNTGSQSTTVYLRVARANNFGCGEPLVQGRLSAGKRFVRYVLIRWIFASGLRLRLIIMSDRSAGSLGFFGRALRSSFDCFSIAAPRGRLPRSRIAAGRLGRQAARRDARTASPEGRFQVQPEDLVVCPRPTRLDPQAEEHARRSKRPARRAEEAAIVPAERGPDRAEKAGFRR